MGKSTGKAAPAKRPASPKAAASYAQAIDDLAVVTAAMVDGDCLDSPDVGPCVRRLRLHREGELKVPGYPPRKSDGDWSEESGPRRGEGFRS